MTKPSDSYKRLTVILPAALEARLLAERAKIRAATGLPVSKSAIAAVLIGKALAEQ